MTYEQIHTLFKQGYNQANWNKFLGETFTHARLLATPETLTDIDSNVASKVLKLGSITLNENGIERQIAVYEVQLAKGIILERNRVGLRNLLRKYWKNIDAAFIVYHNPDALAAYARGKWRFSYVSELTGYDAEGKFIKIKTEPKRYTYVLGEGESTRTAAERFALLAKKANKATLDDVKEAFSVEKLSKAFFDEYTQHYQKFCNYLQESNFRKSVFNISIPTNATKEEKDKACKPIRDFVKKLLGRIVFLYFVQKKGWLGASDTQYKDGMPDFINQLFKQSGGNDTFYPNWLTVLFFQTLNKERSNNDFKMPDGKKVKVPFLNGGLFDKEDYDEAMLTIPAKLFHHPDFEDVILTENNWNNARGFLDFLDAFNFTVHEDSPDDRTVAVDPEMLGHIFENLLEDNKDKGAFYTHKEIVHYMCQESLTEYLKNSPPSEGRSQTGVVNSPPSEGWSQTGVVNSPQQEGWSQTGVVNSPPQEGKGGGRNSQNYFNLPYNPALKERARALRKAGNLPEVLFWNQVKNKQFKGYDFDRQKIIGNYIVDFFCTNCNVVIEIDGSSHDDKVEYDAERDKYLQSLGLQVIHIPVEDVMNNLDAVMQNLYDHPALSGTPPTENLNHPALSGTPPTENLNHPALSGTPPTEGNFTPLTWEQKVSKLVKQKDASLLGTGELEYISRKLDTVKICDPAIGSGAFPMGLLQEIHAIKEVIAYELQQQWNPAEVKENIIQNSIYGVDIEKGAVDIARLRFWLSLVADEEKPMALPNLDCKIVVGDSLVSKFEGEIIEIDWEIKEGTLLNVFDIDNDLKRETLLKQITAKQKEYFHATHKQKLATEIRNLKIDLLINQLELMVKTKGIETKPSGTGKKITKQTQLYLQTLGWKKSIEQLKKLKSQPDKPLLFFDWKLDFPEVLNELVNPIPGFDIVIGNPPYIKEYTNRDAFDGFRNSPYYQGKMDIWYGFACKMLDLLKPKGIECFIAQNNWITSAGASIFRDKVLSESEIKIFTDFGNYKVFKTKGIQTKGIQTMIYILQKGNPRSEYNLKYSVLKNDKIDKAQLLEFLDFTIKDDYSENFFFKLKPDTVKGKPFTFNNNIATDILFKIKEKGNFYLTEKEVAQGIVFPQDFVNKKSKEKLKNIVEVGEGIFALKESELNNLKLNISEKKLIRPYYTTDELHRYYANPKNKLWIIYTGSEFKNPKSMQPYPNLKKHLDRFKDVITSDNKPYGLHRAREERFFKGESIIAQRKCPDRPSFTYTDFDCYVSATFYVIKTERVNMKYLTGLLNSKLIEYWLRNKGKMQGNNFQIDKEPLLAIPLISPNESTSNKIENLVLKIIANKAENKNTESLEQQIDNLVFRLYELSYEEVKVIDPAFPLSKEEYENIKIE